ncbi:MAG: sarcosine oxidase subunit gamma [Pseudomonadota bacterium]
MVEDAHRRSPLGHLAAPRPRPDGALWLCERPFMGLVDLRLAPGDPALLGPAQRALGLELPLEANRSASGAGVSALWLGPDEWLIVTESGGEAGVAANLRAALAGRPAAVTEVGDGRTTIEIGGARARDVLRKGCLLDIHPRVFAPGACAQTGIAKARVILRLIDARPCFHILVDRSYAEYLWRWLADAGLEFAP